MTDILLDHMTGRVRWYSPEKGYGFIAPEDGSGEVFVRQTDIQMDGFRSLGEGQRVAFVLHHDAHGPSARGVRPV